LVSAPFIHVVSGREDRSRDAIEEFCRLFVSSARAAGDVSSTDENRHERRGGSERLEEAEHADRQQTGTNKDSQIFSLL
jgi:hypothetical protein